MQVRKAVITAAAPDQHRLPLQTLVDRAGAERTALELIIQETVAAGVDDVCIVIRPGDENAFRVAAGDLVGHLHFVLQDKPRGYADALHRARDFVSGEPYLHLVGDHLYVSGSDVACARQLVDVAAEFGCSVSAVQATRENRLPYFGIVAGPHVPRRDSLYEIQRVIEKPTPTLAEQELVTPGLRAGHYLGFFGMHVLTPEVDALIADLLGVSSDARPSLSDALAMLPARGRYLAAELSGARYNLGIRYGLLKAQLAISLSGVDRDQILTELIDLLATRPEEGAAS